jgi:hypothetical protein
MTTLLTRVAILAAADLTTEDVEVPEWGGVARIKSMTGAERDVFEDTLFTGSGTARKQDLKNFRAKLVAATIVDEAGVCLFTMDEVQALSQKSAAALTRCAEVAQRINGMSQAAVVDAKTT